MKLRGVLFANLKTLLILMFLSCLAHAYFSEQKTALLIILYTLNTILAAVPIVGLYWAIFIRKQGVLSLYFLSVLLKALVLGLLFLSPLRFSIGFEEVSKSSLMVPFFVALLSEIIAFLQFHSQQEEA